MRRLVTIALCGVCAAAVAAAPAVAGNAVMAWGSGLSGRLGNGTELGTNVPVAVTGLSDVTAVSRAGYEYTLGLRSNGSVVGWGSNRFGTLGTFTGPETCGSDHCSRVPVQVEGVSEATAVSAGGTFGTALLSNGTVMAWGTNSFGQLGDGTTTNKTPVLVGELSEVEQVSAGYQHALALLDNGTVMAWGENDYGQLGDETHTGPEECEGEPCSRTPVKVTGLSNVIAVSAAYKESLALRSDGTVWVWGENKWGQLGDGSTIDSDVPVQVSGLSEVVAIAAGYYYNAALLSNGTVKTWGWNRNGQLGDGTNTGPEKCPGEDGKEGEVERYLCSRVPVAVTGLSGVTAVSVGQTDHTSFALREDGTVWAWGENEVAGEGGALGNGEANGPEECKSEFEADGCSTVPVRVTGLVDVVGVAAGGAGGYAELAPPSPPEFGRCLKVRAGMGRFENGGCSKYAGEGTHEWYPAIEHTHFATSSGEATLKTVSGFQVVCKAESGTGEYSGRKMLAGVVLRFQECSSGLGTCRSTGASAGEIVTSSLNAVLGIEKASAEAINNHVAVDFSPVEAGAMFAEFTCGGGSYRIRGSVLSPIVENAMSATPKLKFAATSGKQKPEKFEGGPTDVLEQSVVGTPFVQVGLTAPITQSTEEKVEVNTVI
jgi:alpha-tubulin suppressor-like RCC1 family protein